jgi:hypothetical protein
MSADAFARFEEAGIENAEEVARPANFFETLFSQAVVPPIHPYFSEAFVVVTPLYSLC